MPHHSFGRIPLTAAAYQQAKEEVAKLLAEKELVMGRLKAAREMGDLSENGAYKYAKFELGNIRRRLRELYHLLEFGEVTENQSPPGEIGFGSQITLENHGKHSSYQVVSQFESNPLLGKLSMDSPLGQALLGKHVGETVEISTPNGVRKFRVISVS